jgi:hypothetical protein
MPERLDDLTPERLIQCLERANPEQLGYLRRLLGLATEDIGPPEVVPLPTTARTYTFDPPPEPPRAR